MQISICMIVKNEEKVLARCLDSLQGLYEELIIVDTGSTDNTKKIAESYTTNIYDYVWKDDFADARNYAFSKATKDYIYSVDADEVLDEVNRKRFLELKNNLLPEIEIVQMWYVNTNEFATTENFEKEYRPKLYKRIREFRWIDPIHESVNLNPVVFDSDIEILHMPQSSHGKRDFGVFQKALSRGENLSKKLHKMYARELMIAGELSDFEMAENYFLSSVWDANCLEEEKQQSYVVLSKLYRLEKNVSEFFKWSLKNICTQPSAEICNEIGFYYFEQNDLDEAMVWFENAASETEPILDIRAGNEIPNSMLAKCYELLAENDEIMRDIYLMRADEYRMKNQNQ